MQGATPVVFNENVIGLFSTACAHDSIESGEVSPHHAFRAEQASLAKDFPLNDFDAVSQVWMIVGGLSWFTCLANDLLLFHPKWRQMFRVRDPNRFYPWIIGRQRDTRKARLTDMEERTTGPSFLESSANGLHHQQTSRLSIFMRMIFRLTNEIKQPFGAGRQSEVC